VGAQEIIEIRIIEVRREKIILLNLLITGGMFTKNTKNSGYKANFSRKLLTVKRQTGDYPILWAPSDMSGI
jgi:hypothetical protein